MDHCVKVFQGSVRNAKTDVFHLYFPFYTHMKVIWAETV